MKGGNILIDSEGVPKICDFGWACYYEQDRRRRSLSGTEGYISPEIYKKNI